jgi:hypothetical protein
VSALASVSIRSSRESKLALERHAKMPAMARHATTAVQQPTIDHNPATVAARCMKEGIVGGEAFAVDASIILATRASRSASRPRSTTNQVL